MTHNLAEKPQCEREQIELDKAAALAIYKPSKGKITRHDIEVQIASITIENQPYFRERLNHHKNGGLPKSKQESI